MAKATAPDTVAHDINTAPGSSADTSIHDALRQDVQSLQADVSALLKTVAAFTEGAAEKGLREGRNAAEKASWKAEEAKNQLETQIRARPMAAIGIAAAAGFLIAALRGSK